MGETKYSRKDMTELLSKAVSIEEIVIDTVSEMAAKKVSEVSEEFKKSECHKNLFDFSTGYHLNDINLIVADFARECVNNLGWKI